MPERPPEIGVDERRMQVRAYNYWVSLLERPRLSPRSRMSIRRISRISARTACCSISPQARTIPASPSSAARCASNASLDAAIDRISQVPGRSLLSRLTDHYMQIIANCAPIGFEAEFVGQRGHNTALSRHPDAAVVERRGDRFHLRRDQLERAGGQRHGARACRRGRSRRRRAAAVTVWADGPSADDADCVEQGETLSLWPEDGGLADRLAIARDSADEAEGERDAQPRRALSRARPRA